MIENVWYYIILVFSFILLVTIVYILFYYKFNLTEIKRDAEKWAQKLSNGPLQSLLNGSGINNIPMLNIISPNSNVIQANQCSNAPLFMGPLTTNINDVDCIMACVNDNAKVFTVTTKTVITFDTSVLKSGNYCTLGPRPECNMNTTYALMTINSITCLSKFPKLIGGKLGTEIVACNNQQIYSPNNILWDYKNNEPVDVFLTTFINEDEQLKDGQYRFRCNFNGLDIHSNKYIQHPQNRLHPIKNYCTNLIVAAHPDVKMIIRDDGNSFTCDCGDPNVTRVKHINPNDPQSQCSTVSFEVETVEKSKQRITIPYKCFTLFSPISDVAQLPPCPDELFTDNGSKIAAVSFEFTTDPNALIEHPLYHDFEPDSVSGAQVRIDFPLVDFDVNRK